MPSERIHPETVEFDVRTDEMLISMGPQHPSTHGVLRVVLRTDGELVTEVTPHIGYLHRCAEKIGENLTPRQFLPYTDRLDYLAGMSMNLGWALCVEKLLGLTVSEKTRHLRLIIVELSRIANHLVAASSSGLDLGSFTPFTWTFREREKIVNLFEDVCGARLTYNYIAAGRRDGRSARRLAEKVREVSRRVHAGDRRIARDVDQQRDLHPPHGRRRGHAGGDGDRLRLHRPGAARQRRRLGLAPRRRADLHADVRRLHVADHAPVDGSYPTDHVYPPVPREAVVGDSWHRYFVRMVECVQSMDLIRQGMEKYSKAPGEVDGPIEVKKKLPKGEAYLETEAPKGQMGFMIISDGTPIPWRVRHPQQQFLQSLGDVGNLPRRVRGRPAGRSRIVGYRVGRN